MTGTIQARPDIDAFHQERSKCIDAFAALEAALAHLLDRGSVSSASQSLGQKLDLARKLKPNPRLSKAKIARLGPQLARCEALNLIRNDVVHARLELAILGDEQLGCFLNVRDLQSGSRLARLFTLEGLRILSNDACKLASELGLP